MIIKSIAITAIFAISAISAEKDHKETIRSVGIYLDIPEYDQSAFALLEEAEESMETAFPGVPWETIDSASPKVKLLPSALHTLGGLNASKPDSQANHLLKAIGARFDKSHLLVIRRGGTKATRDSSASFQDHASFDLVNCAHGTTTFHKESQSTGTRGKTSAETAWAKGAWRDFVKGWKANVSAK